MLFVVKWRMFVNNWVNFSHKKIYASCWCATMCYQAFCVFNVAETVDSLGGTGIDVESMASCLQIELRGLCNQNGNDDVDVGDDDDDDDDGDDVDVHDLMLKAAPPHAFPIHPAIACCSPSKRFSGGFGHHPKCSSLPPSAHPFLTHSKNIVFRQPLGLSRWSIISWEMSCKMDPARLSKTHKPQSLQLIL